jgi:hypothetical protein
LAGCASAPTVEEQQHADYGARPTTYVDAVHSYFESTLKDPDSLQIREIAPPVKAWERDAPIKGGKLTYGWFVTATINAKNSYGGYVGFQTYTFVFRGEQMVDVITPETPVR